MTSPESDLRQRLAAHEWVRGDMLPADSELAAHYGVSLPEIYGALESIAADGLIKLPPAEGAWGEDTVSTPVTSECVVR